MSEELLSVEQVAQMMDMHTRTIRRYIKEGKLVAAKFGGQWRVKKSDLKNLMSNSDFLEESETIWTSNVENFLQGKSAKGDHPLQICSIADCYLPKDKINQLSQQLLNLMNSDDPIRSYAKFQYMYDEMKSKARFILWANPKFMEKLINKISIFDEVENENF